MAKQRKPKQKQQHITPERRDRFAWDTSEGITITRADENQPAQPEQIPPAKRK